MPAIVAGLVAFCFSIWFIFHVEPECHSYSAVGAVGLVVGFAVGGFVNEFWPRIRSILAIPCALALAGWFVVGNWFRRGWCRCFHRRYRKFVGRTIPDGTGWRCVSASPGLGNCHLCDVHRRE